MKSIRRLFLQSKPKYILLLMTSGIFIALSIMMAVNPLNLTILISLYLSIFLLLQVTYLITHCFPMSLAMGESREKSIQDIFSFTLMANLFLSIFINIMLIFSNISGFGHAILPYLMGYNWNIITGTPSKFITLLLILSALSGSVMWLMSGFKAGGFSNGFARILIILIVIFAAFSKFSDYIVWGRNSMLVHIILLSTALLTHHFSYRTLIRYELQYGEAKKSNKKYIFFIIILIITVLAVNPVYHPFKSSINSYTGSSSFGASNISPSKKQITVDASSLMKFKIAAVTGDSLLSVELVSEDTGKRVLDLSAKDLTYSTFKRLERGKYILIIEASENSKKGMGYSYKLQISSLKNDPK